jgi:hypothetical protein
MKPIKLDKASIAAAQKKCSGIEAYEKSTNKPVWAKWWLFYTQAKKAGLHPSDTQPAMAEAAASFRAANGLKHSPRAQRSVLEAIWEKSDLPITRPSKPKKRAVSDDPLDICREALRQNLAGIKRVKAEMEKLGKDLAKYQTNVKKLEKMEKTLKED